MLFPEDPDYAYIIDLVGGAEDGSIEDVHVYLRYYADEKLVSSGDTTGP